MPAKLYINLNNLKYNVESVKKHLFKNQELLVMVKADAYGSGLVETTKYLEKIGVKNFGVAYLKEAKLLKENNVKADIIVFSGLLHSEIKDSINVNAIYSVSSVDILSMLNKEAKKNNKIVKVELAIDTGMTRLGFNKNMMQDLAEKLKEFKNIKVHGIYTHLSKADSDDKFTLNQLKLFDTCVDILKNNNIDVGKIHALNSAGIIKYNDSKYDMVRLGISAYGYYPDEIFKKDIKLKPVFKLVAPICFIHEVEKGHDVSYNGTYKTDKKTKIAVLQIGYADGITRALSNNFYVVINNKKARIIGNICMDTLMVDVTNIDCSIEDEAIIFDFDYSNIEDIAKKTNTIVYEVITNIGKRVDRKYIK